MTGPARRRPSPQAVGIPVLGCIPANEEIRRKSASYQIVGAARQHLGATV